MLKLMPTTERGIDQLLDRTGLAEGALVAKGFSPLRKKITPAFASAAATLAPRRDTINLHLNFA